MGLTEAASSQSIFTLVEIFRQPQLSSRRAAAEHDE
jgi:hypothetical protein